MEQWKDIEGFENYMVSSLGRFYSKKRDKIMKPTPDNKGYLRISFYEYGKSHTKKVHRLVAEAFIENPNNLPQVNHKNEDKLDNRVENLEWVDNGENQKHAIEHNLKRIVSGEEHYMCKLSDKDVEEIRRCYKFKHPIYNQVELAKKYGLSQAHISAIIRNKTRII